MAIHRAKVIGQLKVCDVAPGGIIELDDEKVNLAALLAGENVELLPGPKPGSKEALIAEAEALGLSTEGTKTELEERIAKHGEGDI